MHIDPALKGISIIVPSNGNVSQSSLVVIVEDDKRIRQLLCKILVEGQGYMAIVCEQTEPCWQFIQSYQYPIFCVITEVRFTRHRAMDGVRLARRIKMRFPSIPIIALLGPLDIEIAGRLNESDVQTIKKPFQVTDILDAINGVVSQ